MEIDIALPKIWLAPLMDKNRLIIICAGRRSGKTQFSTKKVLLASLEKYKNRYGETLTPWIGYYQATQDAAIATFWDRIKECLEFTISRTDNTRHTLDLKTGAKFSLNGIDTQKNRLRGTYKSLIIIDEAAFIANWKIVNEVLIPQLADVDGQLIVLSTPKGYNDFYHLWKEAKDTPGVSLYHFKSSDGGYITEDQIPELARLMQLTPDQVREEFYAEFLADSSFVYASFLPERHLTEDIYLEKGETIRWAWDFNMNPACHTTVSVASNGITQVLDEICDGNVDENCKHFLSRYNSFDNPMVEIYGDANGKHTYINGSPYDRMTDLLTKAGFEVSLFKAKANPSVINRIQTVNTAMYAGKLEIHKKNCPKLVKDFENLRYKLGSKEPDKNADKNLSHSSDALGYQMWWTRPETDLSFEQVQSNMKTVMDTWRKHNQF